MNMVLERADEITTEELEYEIRAYERFYGITTEELLAWIRSDDERVDEIEDAGFWRSTHDLLRRLRDAPVRPDVCNEDPNRVLVLFHAR